MKKPALIIIVLALISSGCEARKKIPFYGHVINIIDPNKERKTPEEKDFDTIADELEEQMVTVSDPL